MANQNSLLGSYMDYQTFIKNIINNRGQWNIPDGEYYEPHHIIPKCLGGLPLHYQKNKKAHHLNIIWLTAKEHFEAHRLLYLENPNNRKLIWTFMVMCEHHPEYSTSKDYEEAKLKLSKSMTGKKWSFESRKKLSDSCKRKFVGKKNGMYGKKGVLNHLYGKKLPDYRLQQISNFHKGKKLSEITKEKIKNNAKNNPNYGNKGKHISEKQKQIIRESNSKSIICLETNKIYNSLFEASKEINCSSSLICLVCKGKRENAKKLHFKYIDSNQKEVYNEN